MGIITVLDGDIQKPNLGLEPETRTTLQEDVDIVVHAASSINLRHSLSQVFERIVLPSESLAQMAMEFDNLDRFVYVSTAFANSHLYKVSDKAETEIEESIYPLLGECETVDNSLASAEDARDEIRKCHSSAEYRSHDFPWPYAYAKHLAERLILARFAAKDQVAKLLILRPSVIGPAERFPYPGYCVARSAPSMALAAAMIISPAFNVIVATRCNNPEVEATIDEVPVDVVVDRLLAHLANHTTGCVHAVGGEKGRLNFRQFYRAVMQLRRLPWPLSITGSSTTDWHSAQLHPVFRFYVILGTAFLFSERKTESLWGQLHPDERGELALFKQVAPESYELTTRREHICDWIKFFAKRTYLPAWLLVYLCR